MVGTVILIPTFVQIIVTKGAVQLPTKLRLKWPKAESQMCRTIASFVEFHSFTYGMGRKLFFGHEHVLVRKWFLPEPLRSSCLLSNQSMLCILLLVLAGGLVGNEGSQVYSFLFYNSHQSNNWALLPLLCSLLSELIDEDNILAIKSWTQFNTFHALLIHLARTPTHHSKPVPFRKCWYAQQLLARKSVPIWG